MKSPYSGRHLSTTFDVEGTHLSAVLNTEQSFAKVRPWDICYITVLLLILIIPMYLHQAVLVPFLVPAIVQEQANTALLRHDGSDECRVQAQVSGYSFNWHLIFSQAYNVCLSSLPYHGRSCGVGKGRLTHPPIQNPRFPLDWVYQRTNLSFEENTATPSWSVVLEEKAQPCWL